MTDDPASQETLRLAITAIRLTPSLNQTSTTRAIAFATKMPKNGFGVYRTTPDTVQQKTAQKCR
jgi:hypothetical protein